MEDLDNIFAEPEIIDNIEIYPIELKNHKKSLDKEYEKQKTMWELQQEKNKYVEKQNFTYCMKVISILLH